jgi:hypothetical protein
MDRNSSYAKVYVALTKTETWNKLIEAVETKLRDAKVDSVAFKCTATSEKVFVYPLLKIMYSDLKTEEWEYGHVNDAERWSISYNHLWNATDFWQVIDNHFGPDKDVKTRNCKLEVLKHGNYKKDTKSFYSWASDMLETKYLESIKETVKRLRVDCLKVLATETYAQALKDAEVKFCKSTITAAMMQWRHMPDEILREAWDQFIATAVMEE